ncbi:MAG: imidazoleglycerol-phosphate dehydratase HisB [Oscillospiraceae bacterium]|jgi:imidazoleglycerol-phosphate dehydratase|nr:imidazoleglycerol-phosphate dehydratase HisB [Oscillospiraceae bacterium]
MRKSEIARKTAETDIALTLDLDGCGNYSVDTGVGFLDHMLALFAVHGRFDLSATCKGDVRVDAHHTVEDMGLTLGAAVSQALGDRRGINRYGEAALPMDETLVLCALDISGRSHLTFAVPIPSPKIGEFDSELVEEFFVAFARACAATIHLREFSGGNSHHIAECCFKAFARALSKAVGMDGARAGEIPSSKGTLT